MIVWLPAQQQTREISPEPTAQARPAPLPRGSETVLLIDDDPAVGRTVENILTSLGYCVMSYGQPDEALGFISNNAEDVHLILLDVNLPRYPLEDMFARVRERCPHAPVLLASGFDLREQCLPFMQRGAAGFVQKPFSLATLATMVRSALDRVGQRVGR